MPGLPWRLAAACAGIGKLGKLFGPWRAAGAVGAMGAVIRSAIGPFLGAVSHPEAPPDPTCSELTCVDVRAARCDTLRVAPAGGRMACSTPPPARSLLAQGPVADQQAADPGTACVLESNACSAPAHTSVVRVCVTTLDASDIKGAGKMKWRCEFLGRPGLRGCIHRQHYMRHRRSPALEDMPAGMQQHSDEASRMVCSTS